MSLRWLAALLACTACSVDLDYERTTLAFDPVSPPKPGGGAQPVVAAGTTILTVGHISWDDGVTWAPSNPAITFTGAQIWNETQILVSTSAFGWGRWSRDTDQVEAINPPFQVGLIHLRAATGSIIINEPGTGNLARQSADGTWSQTVLPAPPSNPAGAPNIYDVTSTADAVFLIADWGIYRSADDGVSWAYVYDPNVVAYFLPLPDGRVALLGQARSSIIDVIDSSGMPLSIARPSLPGSNPFSCLGAIVLANGQFSTDLGLTWQSIFPTVPGVSFSLGGMTCGGDYLVVMLQSPSQWLVKMSAFQQLDFVYTYTPSPGSGGSGAYVRSRSGTVFADGLAWTPGESTWRIRMLPPNYEIHALGDGSLWGNQGRLVVRSTDDGVTWTSMTATEDLPAYQHVFAEPGGTMWASAALYQQAQLWRSTDHGLSWTLVYDRMGMLDSNGTPTGELGIELLGIASDGTFVGRSVQAAIPGSHFHVSSDQGMTWRNAAPVTTLPFHFLFLTGNDHGVTFDDNDESGPRAFHLWRDYGAGNAFKQVTPLVPGTDPTTMEMTHLPADLTSVLPTISIDADSYMWWYGGAPQQGAWRSREPID